MSVHSTRVAIASDNRLFAVGLAQALSAQSDFAVSVCDPSISNSLAQLAASNDVVLLDAAATGGWPRLGVLPDRGIVIFVGAPDDDGDSKSYDVHPKLTAASVGQRNPPAN